MKPKVILSALCALTLVTVFSALMLSRRNSTTNTLPPGAQTFEVGGQIRSLDTANKTVRIAHEEISDYMPAMTMPFSVRDTALLNGLSAGNAVSFRLVVTEDDSWIDRIAKIGAGNSGFAAAASETMNQRDLDRVQPGERAPDFTLTNQDGKPVRLSDFKGKAVILTFIYTRCPIPNFCPLMSKNFAELQKRLADEFPDRAQLLSVSIDPEFDQPDILRSYAARYEADHTRWTFATGTREEIDLVGASFGLIKESAGGLINHDLRTALIGPDGRLVHLWKSNVWTPYEVQRRVRETLTGNGDVAAR